MTEKEVEVLLRKLLYKLTVEEGIKELYKVVNGTELPKKKDEVAEGEKGEKVYVGIAKDSKYKDAKGERIYFPNDERPYYDKALQRTFNTKKEKWDYMKKNKLVMDGSSDRIKMPVEAGDTRNVRVR